MADVQKCTRCGRGVSPGAPRGHCLHCLLEFALELDSEQPVPPSQPAAVAEEIGGWIGPYQLLGKLGEGGCGTVYLASQREPIRRNVALKIIKLGMDTKAVVARFAAEKQALARMDHPGIAKVFDAGATDSGRPYFVMEWVQGQKITSYCDTQKLDVRQRIALFMQVCAAVQHAHQKGIVHRDLKPSNILVSSNEQGATPKIIDFGIAKAVSDQPLTDKTYFTAFEQFLGTPAYMSPEQAGLGLREVDGRSDVYSLGILLYELLTGAPPFDAGELRQAALDEILRTIREKEPSRPSSRVPSLRGDLDRVVLKSLYKDRSQRYQSAADLADDLDRFLTSRPVKAAQASVWYMYSRAVSRHRRRLVDAALVLAVVLAVLIPLWAYEAHHRPPQNAFFTSSPVGAWRYSELIERQPKGTSYFPTSPGEYAGAVFRGYTSPRECKGQTSPISDEGPDIFDPGGNTGYQILTTWVESSVDRDIDVVISGDDGHSLFVDDQFLAGSGFGFYPTNRISFRAGVPRKLELAIYNSVGGWSAYIGLAPFNGFVKENWSKQLTNVPGLSMNADGFSSKKSNHP